MRIKLFIISLLVLVVASCSDDDSFSTAQSNLLTFSSDTVSFDTVFSNVPTTTRSFWVYNRSSDGIRCSSVRLSRGNQGGFRVNVDGTYLGSDNGYQTQNVEIRKGDSLRVFVELTSSMQYQSTPQSVDDDLLFTLESGREQRVHLNAWSWDAIQISNLQVDADTTISSTTPIIVYGGITVAEDATLTIAAGTTLYFHADAGMQVNGTLKVMGTAEQPVTLRGDRLDNMFDYLPYDFVPGQWQGIRLSATSYNNVLNHTDLHGSYNGLVADSSDVTRLKLTMTNSIVHNCQGYGVSLNHVKAVIENCQLSNALNDCLYIAGGDVEINNCTLAQFYPFDSDRGVSIRFSAPLEQLLCRNTLITGYADDEMMGETGDVFNYQFEDCVIRTPSITTADSVYFKRVYFENVTDTVGQGRWQFKLFDTDNLRYDFSLDSTSVAIDRANAGTALSTDLKGLARDEHPDVGAYEYVSN